VLVLFGGLEKRRKGPLDEMLQALVLNFVVSEVQHFNVPEQVLGQQVDALGLNGNLVKGA
jgi:hypothetical protein